MRAGARVAAVSRQTPDPVAAAQSAVVQAGTDLSLSPADVAVASSWTAGAPVTVSVAKRYPISIFGISVTSVDLSSSTTERVE